MSDDGNRDDDGANSWRESLAHSLVLLAGMAWLVWWVVYQMKGD